MQMSKHIGVVVLGVLLMALAFALAPASQAAVKLTPAERSLLTAVNDVRVGHNLRRLRVDPALVRAARSHSTSLLRRNIFEHGSFIARIERHGGRGPMLGENLAWGTGRRATARNIVNSWLKSPGHRSTLLRPGWNRIGIGARTGRFLGYEGVTVVTADFAGR